MNKITIVFFFLFVVCSCKNLKKDTEKEKQLSKIKKIEKQLHTDHVLNANTGKAAFQQYMNYASTYPDDSIAPDYLFKAGEIATHLKDYEKALNCYELISTHYPAYPYLRESLYLQANLLDNFLNDDSQAKQKYEEFLLKYPTGNFTEDAKAAITHLGKTDEELIKEFEEKNR